jgi:hypothetical protein
VCSLVPTVSALSPTFARASAATSCLATGILKTDVATNVARCWFDSATFAHQGYLAEGARTNLCLRSEDIANAAWTGNNSTVTANATVAPDGATTGDRIVETAVNSEHTVVQAFTKAASALQYTFSAHMKAQQRTASQILPRDSSKFAGVNWDMTTGAEISRNVVTWTCDQFFAKQHENSWWRAHDTFTTDTGTVINANVRLRDAVGQSYLGDVTKGAYLWGAQLELGAFASSYIPTTSAAVTRAKDDLSYTISSVLGATENTYFINARTARGPGTQTYLSVDDGTANERVTIQRNTSNQVHVFVVDGGVTQADLNLGVVANDTSFKVALRVKANDIAASLNGAAVVTDATATLPTLTTLRVGEDHALANQAFAPIKTVVQYATGLTNAQLVTLAT